MKIRPVVPAVLALALLGPALASAEPVPFQIDPVHSQVGFSVRHFFGQVPGRFNDFAGTILFDEQHAAASSVETTIQAASIYTNEPKRDTHLRGPDFFDAEKYPTITFKSTKVSPAGKGKYKIAGNLTMHGVTRPVVLDTELLGVGAVGIGGQAMGTRAGFSATLTLNRKDYGISWNKVLDNGNLMLSDEVAINLQIEAAKVEAPAGEAKK